MASRPGAGSATPWEGAADPVPASPGRTPPLPVALTIAPLAAAHAADAARLHRAGQPGTFLTRLGDDVLRLIYAALPQAGFGFVAEARDGNRENRGTTCGFISGARGLGDIFWPLVMGDRGRRGLRLAFVLAVRLVRDPGLVRHVWTTLFYPQPSHASPRHRSPKHAPEHTPHVIELLSIMVAPCQRGMGIGGLLMAAFLAECRARGAHAIEVTVDAHNTGACRFYAHHRFAPDQTFALYGRPMLRFRRELL